MIIDSSAIVRIILGESDYQQYDDAIARASNPRISAFSVYEAGAVLVRRKGREAVDAMMAYLLESGITIESFRAADACRATEAYGTLGKGLSPVGLNLGDCPVYALARIHGAPVLSTSDEFVRAGLDRAV